MDAAEFLDHWVAFSQKNDLALKWDEKNWTELTIGRATSSNSESPFGEFLCARMKGTWRFWKEDLSYDLVLSANLNHSQARPPDGWKEFYPAVPDVVIEQELAALTAWIEMGKLVRTRAKLKVLITFTESEEVVNMLIDQFDHLIKDADNIMSEGSSTGYLLLVGQKPDEKVGWRASAWKGTEGPRAASLDR